MIEVPTLATDRFTLRPLQRGDEAALFPTLSDPGHCRYLSHPPFASPEELWGWLAEPDWPGRSWIAVDASGPHEGSVAGRFVAIPGHEKGVEELGYIVCSHRHRQGIARECTRALIEHLWQEGARKLTAEVDTRNAPSVHLLESFGFTREATFREHETSHIGLCDVHWYGLLRREWPAS